MKDAGIVVSTTEGTVFMNGAGVAAVPLVIPEAQVITSDVVSVPHTLQNTLRLRGMGYDVASPITYDYQWSGSKAPLGHQIEAAEFLSREPQAFNNDEMGLGKTIESLWAADYLMREGIVHRCLVIATLSTVEVAWMDTLFWHFGHRRAMLLPRGSAERRLKRFATPADFYVINHDAIQIIEPMLKKRSDIDLFIIDEIACFRDPSTRRFKCLKHIFDDKPRAWRWGLTGSPTPNSPLDAWAQIRLIKGGTYNYSYTKFRDITMKRVTQFKWVPRTDAVDFVKTQMQPAIRHARKDCLDLPDTMVQTRDAILSPIQQKMYDDLLTGFKAEEIGETISATNELSKLIKLLEVCCGCVYTDDGNVLSIDMRPRMQVIEECIEEADGKAIVFVPFSAALHRVASQLEKKYSVAVVEGDTPSPERANIFRSFQQSADPQVIVAHPRTMAHGITLTEASVIIWAAPIWSAEYKEQADNRISRMSQHYTANIVHIVGSPLEAKMYKRLSEKQTVQGTLLELLKERTNNV